MRILQLIDNLQPGGAEKMAVNYANALLSEGFFSGLIVTRSEGKLASLLHPDVNYFFLNRKSVFDLKALFRFRKYVRKNAITHIHAHGTSFFFATLIKLLSPAVKIIWHDHNGDRTQQKISKNRTLKVCSFFFNGILTVNHALENWSRENLECKNVRYIPNFTVKNETEKKETILKGNEGKRIVCMANLRYPKNHITLLKAFHETGIAGQGWTVHLVGGDYNDDYSGVLKKFIRENKLEDSVFIYGSKTDVFNILSQASIAVLCSTYEGFPVTLLEYGLSELAVLSSNVGYCPEILDNGKAGLLFSPLNQKELADKIVFLTQNNELRTTLGDALKKNIDENFSESYVLSESLKFYQEI